MKTLVAIWLAVLVTGLATTAYVNAEINKLVVNKPFTVKTADIDQPYNPQRTIDGVVLQPAAKVQPNFTSTYNPQQTAPATVLTTATEIN